MLTTYFKHPFTLRRLRSDPAGPYLDDFACELAGAGYCRDKVSVKELPPQASGSLACGWPAPWKNDSDEGWSAG